MRTTPTASAQDQSALLNPTDDGSDRGPSRVGGPRQTGRYLRKLEGPVGLQVARLGSVGVGLAAWEIAARQADDAFLAPTFTAVVGALVERFGDPLFWNATWLTLQSLIWGLLLVVVIGIPAGMIAGVSPKVEEMLDPYMRVLLSVPLAPMVPIFVLVFGLGLSSRVATVFFFGIAVLIINTTQGVRSVSAHLEEMARSFGAGRMILFRRVLFPGALPGISAGLRLAAGRCVVGMVIAELILVSVGLGKLISTYRGQWDAPNVFAIVVVLILIGLVTVSLMGLLEKRLSKWKIT